MLHQKNLLAVVLVGTLVCSATSPTHAEQTKADQSAGKCIQEALKALAEGKGDWKQFSLTYDDLHGLHGGLTLTIHGSGKVEQEAVREKVGEPKDVSMANLNQLVNLLQKHKAWQQQVVERSAVPDESRARLVIKYKNDSVTIWEWYNDLPKNKRLAEIREFMKSVAWKGIPKN